MTETFGALAQSQPFVLVLDDLQWAGELTLDLLHHWWRQDHLSRRQILVLGLYRSEEANEQLEHLGQASGVSTLHLDRLDDRAVSEIVGDMLALDPPPPALVKAAVHHSEGNCFFLAEYLRSALAEGLLFRDARGRWRMSTPVAEAAASEEVPPLPMPRSLQDLIRRRIDRLAPDARDLLHKAAVVGRDLDEELLVAMAVSTEDWLEGLDELLRHQVLEEVGLQRYRFAHDKIREVVYSALPRLEREALHDLVARILEKRQINQRDPDLWLLGHHWHQAGELARARSCYLEAARRSRDRSALITATRFYRYYLELVDPPTPHSIEIRNELARDVLLVRGRVSESIDEHQRALSEARECSDQQGELVSLAGLGVALTLAGDLPKARAACRQGLKIALAIGDRAQEGRLLDTLAQLQVEDGNLSGARVLYDQALKIAKETEDQRSEATTLRNLGELWYSLGHPGRARIHLKKSAALASRAGDRHGEGMVLGNLALLLCFQGSDAESRELFLTGLRLIRQIGDRPQEGRILGGLALLHQSHGRAVEAYKLYRQALAIAQEVGDTRTEALIRIQLAELLALRAQMDAARNECELARDLARQTGARHAEGRAMVQMARLARLRGEDLEKVERLLLQAEETLLSVEEYRFVAVGLCEQGHVSLAHGRSARRFLKRARRLVSDFGVGSHPVLDAALAWLSTAQHAFDAGETLFRGQRLEDVPLGLRPTTVVSDR